MKEIFNALNQSINTVKPNLKLHEFQELVDRGAELDEISKHDPDAIALGVALLYNKIMGAI